MSNKKTLGEVYKCILDHFGDAESFVSSLIEKRKELIMSNSKFKMECGITSEQDFRRYMLKYEAEVNYMTAQLVQCSKNKNTKFAKTYLNQLAKLVRGTSEQRKYVKKNVV